MVSSWCNSKCGMCFYACFVCGQLILSTFLPGNYEIYAGEISAPKGASIWDSGIKTGDRILKANGTDVNNAYSFVTIVKNSAKNNGIATQKLLIKTMSC